MRRSSRSGYPPSHTPSPTTHHRSPTHGGGRAMQTTEQIERGAQRLAPGQAVVASLQAHGVDTVFGLDGSHVIQVFDALADAPDIAPVTFKHENNAAIAAEVYGRLSAKPAVARLP